MSSFLREEIGVAMSGVKWDVARYKLWQSTRPDIILFTPKQPVLAYGANGRLQCAISQFRQQEGGTYQITGGSAIFTVTSAIQHDAQAFEELKQQWRAEMNATGPRPHQNPRFIPLNTQKGRAQVLINPSSGTPDEAHNDRDIGTPGGTNSFLVNLTKLGAQEWVQGVREGKTIPAGVKMMYEYLRMMPDVGANVKVHGRRLFQHLSSELNVSGGGFLFGGSANIEAAWEQMRRNGTVEITFIGQLPPELEEIRTDMVTTFSNQARQQLFDSLFRPAPEIEDAQAGDRSGLFGGANFALKYRREEEITDLELTIRFRGWTWLQASMDADLTTLFSELDETYINEVNTEMSFPASVVVDADPMLENVAVSWSPSEGKAPEAPVFGADGGNQTYVITSQRPSDVMVTHSAKVNFAPSSWPVIEVSDRQRIGDGGNQVVIKPASWIGRHMIYMFVERDGQIQLMGVENDYLIVNVGFNGPHLSRAIKASARITPFEPVEFSYPLNPAREGGEAKFSAFGVIGGRLLRAPEQRINLGEEAVFILAKPDGIELVSQMMESPRGLARQLLEAGARPIVDRVDAEGARVSSEYERSGARPSADFSNSVSGTVVAVKYSRFGPVIVLESADGERREVPLRMHDLRRANEIADKLDDSRKRVRMRFDAQSYLEDVTVEL